MVVLLNRFKDKNKQMPIIIKKGVFLYLFIYFKYSLIKFKLITEDMKKQYKN